MKKVVYIALLAAFSFVMVGCNKPADNSATPPATGTMTNK